MHRRLWLAAKVIFGVLATATGLVLGMIGSVGPPWPTDPVFVPGAPSFASPFAIPFKVANKSAVFDLHNLSIKCGVATRIQGEPPIGGTFASGQPGKPAYGQVLGVLSRLKAGEERSYTCALAALRIDVGPNPKIMFAEMTFESERDFAWPWEGRKISQSPTFILDISTMPPQWKSAPLN